LLEDVSMKLSLLLFASLAALAAGCTETVEPMPASGPAQGGELLSGGLATDEMAASVSATAYAEGETIRVYAAILARGRFVTLSDGDALTVTAGNQSFALLRQPQTEDGTVRYMGGVRPTGGAMEITVALSRPEGKASAPRTVIHVPPPFRIASTPPVEIRQSEPLAIDLAPAPRITGANELLLVDFDGPCLQEKQSRRLSTDEVGRARVSLSDLALDPELKSCDVLVAVRHVQQHPVDSHFRAGFLFGFAEGVQSRGFRVKLIAE
jgi:hypothetical protein